MRLASREEPAPAAERDALTVQARLALVLARKLRLGELERVMDGLIRRAKGDGLG